MSETKRERHGRGCALEGMRRWSVGTYVVMRRGRSLAVVLVLLEFRDERVALSRAAVVPARGSPGVRRRGGCGRGRGGAVPVVSGGVHLVPIRAIRPLALHRPRRSEKGEKGQHAA